jgi:hypothetical protein
MEASDWQTIARGNRIGEGAEASTARQAPSLTTGSLFLADRFRRPYLCRENTSEPVEVLELGTFWFRYRYFGFRSHTFDARVNDVYLLKGGPMKTEGLLSEFGSLKGILTLLATPSTSAETLSGGVIRTTYSV